MATISAHLTTWLLPFPLDLVPVAQTNSSIFPIVAGIVGLVAGAVGLKLIDILRGRDAKTVAQATIEQAKADAQNLLRSAELEAKEKRLKEKQQHDMDLAREREQLRTREIALDRRDEALQHSVEGVRKQEKMVESNQRKLAEKLQEINRRGEDVSKLMQEQTSQLQRISGLSKEEATKRLLTLLESELEQEVGNRILKHERRLSESVDQKSQEILLIAMQRYAAAHTADSTTSTVDIPNDEMKGRIDRKSVV